MSLDDFCKENGLGTIKVLKYRKAIQIQIHAPTERLFALCDDGTIWFVDSKNSDGNAIGWRQTGPIPQPEK